MFWRGCFPRRCLQRVEIRTQVWAWAVGRSRTFKDVRRQEALSWQLRKSPGPGRLAPQQAHPAESRRPQWAGPERGTLNCFCKTGRLCIPVLDKRKTTKQVQLHMLTSNMSE